MSNLKLAWALSSAAALTIIPAASNANSGMMHPLSPMNPFPNSVYRQISNFQDKNPEKVRQAIKMEPPSKAILKAYIGATDFKVYNQTQLSALGKEAEERRFIPASAKPETAFNISQSCITSLKQTGKKITPTSYADCYNQAAYEFDRQSTEHNNNILYAALLLGAVASAIIAPKM